MKKLKVSVCVITYNHEPYIEQCLQSILSQNTDFYFEIIVGDDCSTDGTVEIIERMIASNPSKIKLLEQPINTGGSSNNIQIHSLAKGEYVAHMDGDDYALPGKLQAQVDILDENPMLSMAAHAVCIEGAGSIVGDNSALPTMGNVSSLLELGTYFDHSSTMYRKSLEAVHDPRDEIVDFYFYIERAIKGNIYLDKRCFGCHRIHSHGISQSLNRVDQIEECYEKAFDRAIELGVSEREVNRSRVRKRMGFALRRYRFGDDMGFKCKIFLKESEYKQANLVHIFLHCTRQWPIFVWLVSFAWRVKQKFL